MAESIRENYEWLGFSLKSIFFIFLGIIGLGYMIGVLLFGRNSLVVLNHLEKEKEILILEQQKIKVANQKLQKKYFELLQLTE